LDEYELEESENVLRIEIPTTNGCRPQIKMTDAEMNGKENVVKVEMDQTENEEKETSKQKKKVETKDASNDVRMFCKHCGHIVDIDN